MGHRPLTVDELKHNYKLMKHMDKCKEGASFSVSSIVSNYILWKEEKFYPKILLQYNVLTRQYWDDFIPGKINEYNEKIYEKCEFKVDISLAIERKKNVKGYFKNIQAKFDEIDNIINVEFQKYMICHYMALIDMGYGSKRASRINSEIVKLFNDCVDKKRNINAIRSELSEYGVEIEMPFDDEPLNFMNYIEVE